VRSFRNGIDGLVWLLKRLKKVPLPTEALLQRYALRGDCYTDCYAAGVKRAVDLPEYIAAFYSTTLFRTERMMLGAVGRPSSKADLEALARGDARGFSAWEVEDRTPSQILLRDTKTGRTGSWLMVAPEGRGSLLYFYARALLRAARAALR